MKHTPGPWITDDHFSDDRHVMNGNGNGPAYIAKIPLTNSIGIRSDAYKSQEANARLIAAAPDLLAALQGFVERQMTVGQRYTNEGQAMLDAIAKALGNDG